MNYTSNYNLNQWELTDWVRMDDFNTDNAKIDGALAGLSAADKAEAEVRASADRALNAALAAHTAELSKRGNCQIYTTSYVGSGKYGESNPNTLTFPHKPLLIYITGSSGYVVILVQGFGRSKHLEGTAFACHPTWQDNSVSWFSGDNASGQMNEAQKTYQVVAFLTLN